jgi:hypothetical protein
MRPAFRSTELDTSQQRHAIAKSPCDISHSLIKVDPESMHSSDNTRSGSLRLYQVVGRARRRAGDSRAGESKIPFHKAQDISVEMIGDGAPWAREY